MRALKRRNAKLQRKNKELKQRLQSIGSNYFWFFWMGFDPEIDLYVEKHVNMICADVQSKAEDRKEHVTDILLWCLHDLCGKHRASAADEFKYFFDQLWQKSLLYECDERGDVEWERRVGFEATNLLFNVIMESKELSTSYYNSPMARIQVDIQAVVLPLEEQDNFKINIHVLECPPTLFVKDQEYYRKTPVTVLTPNSKKAINATLQSLHYYGPEDCSGKPNSDSDLHVLCHYDGESRDEWEIADNQFTLYAGGIAMIAVHQCKAFCIAYHTSLMKRYIKQ